ncbi:MAG TPA: hypothetical protein VH297_01890 [Gaiellaceae bacterium]
MAAVRVECLCCGDAREVQARRHSHLDVGECPRCRYVGWAATAEVDEALRRRLRTVPPESRRLHPA